MTVWSPKPVSHTMVATSIFYAVSGQSAVHGGAVVYVTCSVDE